MQVMDLESVVLGVACNRRSIDRRGMSRDDLIQQGWLIALEALRRFDGRGDVRAYVARRVHTGLTDYARVAGVDKRTRRRMPASVDEPITDDGLTLLDLIPDDTNDPGEVIDTETLTDLIHSAIDRRPARQRQVLRAMAYGMRGKDAAKGAGYTPEHVSVLWNELKRECRRIAA